ncbi:SPASM domain-containing protein [Vulcanisaeta distributa]|uniref:SPASM domain-containing protein n=1 Tax=Vulcanisaeta distributa TaxID=164451 RepID=UPI0006D1E870|nr:SPASM domain-containing protein [Vulcanisaeta distributa]
MRSLGLRELNISVDDFHMVFLRKFSGLNNAIDAVRAALDLGLTVVVGTVKVVGSEITTAHLREVFKDVEDKVFFQEDFATPIDRAAVLRPLVPRYKLSEIKGGCPHVGTLSVHPDGSVAICCGHAAMPNTDYGRFFVIGNVINEDLRTIINRFYRNAFAWYLFARGGPQSLLAKLNPDEEIANICEACYLLVTRYRDSLVKLSLRKKELFKALLSNGGDIGDLL